MALRWNIWERGAGSPCSSCIPASVSTQTPRCWIASPSDPGFGGSEQPRSFTTIDDLAYFYLDFLDQLDLTDTVVVGVSLGAWIAAEIAVKSTARLSHIVLANAVGIKVG